MNADWPCYVQRNTRQYCSTVISQIKLKQTIQKHVIILSFLFKEQINARVYGVVGGRNRIIREKVA